MSERVIAWFSCGAASAVAAKFAVDKYPSNTEIVYCNTLASEDADNARFLRDVSGWAGREIKVISSTKYTDIDDVFERERFMSGPHGARCTVEMKKAPRFAYQHPDDLHIFGYTADEPKRFNDFAQRNPELNLEWILRDNFIRKTDCYRILQEAGIQLPHMYSLGFEHNNCIGCVKATSPAYWQRTARHYPETFIRRARQSRDIGARLVRVSNERVFLDELDLSATYQGGDGDIECGPFCVGTTEKGGIKDEENKEDETKETKEMKLGRTLACGGDLR